MKGGQLLLTSSQIEITTFRKNSHKLSFKSAKIHDHQLKVVKILSIYQKYLLKI